VNDVTRGIVLILSEQDIKSNINAIAVFKQVIENNTDPEIKRIVDNTELYFVPVINVDGYEYNNQTNPNGGGMWRKNKRDNNNNGTFNPNTDGVDLNRNYGFDWGYDDTGSSPDPTTDTYRGPSAFSEPETTAIRGFCNSHNFKTALSFHTFGDLLVYAERADGTPAPDLALQQEYGADMTLFNGYTYGNGSETVNYSTNGDSDCWMYFEQTEKPKIISYTPEIGDENDYFWAPTSRILTLAEENLYMQQYIALAAGNFLKLQRHFVFDHIDGDGDNFPEAGETFDVYFSVKNMGWDSSYSAVTATLSCDDQLITINNAICQIDNIPAQQEAFLQFNITVSEGMISGQQIDFQINLTDNSGYNLTENYEIIFGSPVVVFLDNAEYGTDNWDTGTNWGITDERAKSGINSFADSPYSNYANDFEDTMTLLEPIDLSFANNAFLKYSLRWRLERHFDKIQVEVRDFNNEWTPVDGIHTTYGTGIGVQQAGEPVYNGFRDLKWFDESIRLTGLIGNDLSFRYLIASDIAVNDAGAYIDDICVVAYTDQLMPPVLSYISDRFENTVFTGPFEVVVVASDAQGLTSIQLHYSSNGANYTSVEMNQDLTTTGFYYSGQIPQMEMGTTVSYYATIEDEEGNLVTSDTYTFMITNDPPVVAVDTEDIELEIDGIGTVSSSFEINNNGLLPLYYNIEEIAVVDTRTTNSELKQTSRPEVIFSNLAKVLGRNTVTVSETREAIKNSREPELIIEDTTGENGINFPDIQSVYAEIADDVFTIEVNMVSSDWNNTLVLISCDVDQNIDTGLYPPALGSGIPTMDIGSERELVLDCSDFFGAGVVALLADALGNEVYVIVPLQFEGNTVSVTIPYEFWDDNDENLDITLISTPSPESTNADFAPNIGHGTIGLPGSLSWLSVDPSFGQVSYNIPQLITVSCRSDFLTDGYYEAELHINTNDPVNPLVAVPVSFSVEGTDGEDDNVTPVKNTLIANYPNPFNPQTTIDFSISEDSRVEVAIYNIKGQKVNDLTNEQYEAGIHKLIWKGNDNFGKSVGSGLYLCKMKVNGKNAGIRKMMLLK